MQVLYLDQNKWIDLARATHYPAEHTALRRVLEVLVARAEANKLVLPLTGTNIYETLKINDPQRRWDLAHIQTTLSQGLVFRGRHKRLEVEVTDVLRTAYDLPPFRRELQWFLSNVFLEATLEWNDPRLENRISERVVNFIRRNPPAALFDYLISTPDDVRRLAVSNFSKGVGKLREDIEKDRAREANETKAMRHRIQGARLIVNELDLICSFIGRAKIPDRIESDILRDQCRRIVTDAPTYNIEREIALRLEAQQGRPIQENDFRDMEAFCAVTAYADIVIAENQFSNLAKQARLDKKYETIIATDLLALPTLLEAR